MNIEYQQLEAEINDSRDKRFPEALNISLICFIIMTVIPGCTLQSVNKKEVIGIYQSVLANGKPMLPDGSFETLELREDGTCKQSVIFGDGRIFFAQGVWEWNSNRGHSGKGVLIKGISSVMDGENKVRFDFENTKESSQFLLAQRAPDRRLILGNLERFHYEKKPKCIYNAALGMVREIKKLQSIAPPEGMYHLRCTETCSHSSFLMCIGRYAGMTITNNNNSTATYTIWNTVGLNSVSFGLLPNLPGKSGPMHNITQIFQCIEPTNSNFR